MVNTELIIKTLAAIEDEPERWNQENWFAEYDAGGHCGTSMCFAGHALCQAGYLVNSATVWLASYLKPAGQPAGVGYVYTSVTNADGYLCIAKVATFELGLTEMQSDDLFNGNNGLDRIYYLCALYCDMDEKVLRKEVDVLLGRDERESVPSWPALPGT